MNQRLLEFKQYLLGTGLFKRVTGNNGWCRCKVCPYCGDTKWHLYVRIDLNDDSPVGYNCFKSNCKGIIDKRFLEFYGLEWDESIPRGKRSRKVCDPNEALNVDVLGDTSTEWIGKCREYIRHRVGVIPSDDELRMFGVVGNVSEYSREYLGEEIKKPERRCWFRCTNGALIGREFRDDGAWMRFSGSVSIPRGLYTIKKPFDIIEPVNVCISEGVMDSIGLYYYGYFDNPVFISCLGKDYMSGVHYMLNTGIFGDSVHLRIFKDADVKNVKIDKSICQFFKSVDVYMNTIGKDFGVHGTQIEIEKIMEEN